MKSKYILAPVILCLFTICIITACRKDAAPPTPAPNYSFVEEFDTLANAIAKGWVSINNSRPLGTAGWLQGEFGAGKFGNKGFSAASVSYSGNDFAIATTNGTTDIGTISAWLISPEVSIKDGDRISFFTRTYVNPADYPDRMQVLLNANSSSVNVGSGPLANSNVANNVGDFTTVLLDINPTLTKTGYPGEWKEYTLTISGVTGTQKRRFAFRYFVTNAGSNGDNSYGVGLDKVQFFSK
jgi:hypothetical protein